MGFLALPPVVQLALIFCALIVLLMAAFNQKAATNLIRFLHDLLDLFQRWSMRHLRQPPKLISQAITTRKETVLKLIYIVGTVKEEAQRTVIVERRDADETMEADVDAE